MPGPAGPGALSLSCPLPWPEQATLPPLPRQWERISEVVEQAKAVPLPIPRPHTLADCTGRPRWSSRRPPTSADSSSPLPDPDPLPPRLGGVRKEQSGGGQDDGRGPGSLARRPDGPGLPSGIGSPAVGPASSGSGGLWTPQGSVSSPETQAPAVAQFSVLTHKSMSYWPIRRPVRSLLVLVPTSIDCAFLCLG